MKISQKIIIGSEIIRKRVLFDVSPFLVSWSLTNRCNYQCKYCSVWKTEGRELTTKEVLFIIDELARCGNRAIAFTGGEPLIRGDIGEIVDYCFAKNIYTKITTNGFFIKDKIGSLRKAGIIRLSLDGPREINDAYRQAGAYDRVIQAIKLLREKNIGVALNCIVSRSNLPYIADILNEAKYLNVKIFFQPLEYRNNRDFFVSNSPTKEEYDKAFMFLIAEKERGNRFIGNSLPVLRYFRNCPDSIAVKCWAGVLIWRITTDGIIIGCDRFRGISDSYDCLRGNLKKVLPTLAPIDCIGGCLRNYTIELSYLLSFNLDSIFNLISDF